MSGVGWQRHLLRYAGSYRRGLAAGCGHVVGQALVVVALPWPVKLAVDNVLKGQPLPGWAGWLDDVPGAATDAGRLVLLGVVTVLLGEETRGRALSETSAPSPERVSVPT